MIRLVFTSGVLLAFGVMTPGCSDPKTELTFASQTKPLAMVQSFPQGSCSRNIDGNFDFVFITDSESGSADSDGGKPLLPMAGIPTRQIVHVRVFWQPLRGMKGDYPAATNAVIDWHVFMKPSDGAVHNLHYSGVGFVRVRGASPLGARIDIRNTTLSAISRQGGMTDPLGACELTGSAVAATDDARVLEVLKELPSNTHLKP